MLFYDSIEQRYLWELGVITEITIKVTVFFDVPPCSLVDIYRFVIYRERNQKCLPNVVPVLLGVLEYILVCYTE
jgi:hypothetical protein